MIQFLSDWWSSFYNSDQDSSQGQKPEIFEIDDNTPDREVSSGVALLNRSGYELGLALHLNPNGYLLDVSVNENQGLHFLKPSLEQPKMSLLQQHLAVYEDFGQNRLCLPSNQKLNTKSWLNDKCIDWFGHSLSQVYPDFAYIDVLDMEATNFNKRLKSRKIHSQSLKEQLQDKKKIVYATQTDNHWYAVMLDLSDSENPMVYCVDGFNRHQNHHKLFEQAKQLIKWVYPYPELALESIKTKSLTIPKQGNSYDCGAVVGLMFYLFAKDSLTPQGIECLEKQEYFDYGPFRTTMATFLAMDQTSIQKLKRVRVGY